MNHNDVMSRLKKYSDIIEELKDAKIIRSSKVVGDFAEYLACRFLNLKLMPPANKGYDAIDELDKKKYEIKSRKSTLTNKASKITVNPERHKEVDFLVYIEFGSDWKITRFMKIPMKDVIRRWKGKKDMYVADLSLKKYEQHVPKWYKV